MNLEEVMRTNPPPDFRPSSASATDKSIELANTVVAIVKEVGELLSTVPYVKSLSGVVLQLIRVRNEFKSNEKRCLEIIDKALRMAKSLYEQIAEVARSSQREKLVRLEGHLAEHERTLAAVYASLQKHRSRSRLDRLVDRGLDELNEHDRRLDELNTQLLLHMVFNITLEQASSSLSPTGQHALTEPTSESEHSYSVRAPPAVKPDLPTGQSEQPRVSTTSPSTTPNQSSAVAPTTLPLLVERESQLETIIEILLRGVSSRIAILGGDGMGKSTLVRTVLEDDKIIDHYMLRYLLSCDGVHNVDALLLELGDMLGLHASPSLMLEAMQNITHNSATLLCIDDFETLWEPSKTRTQAEKLLENIAGIPNLSLVVILRGNQRPDVVAWSEPLLPPLPKLSLDGTKNDVDDKFAIQLLQSVDGIPSAVMLVSKLLRSGENPQYLCEKWFANDTNALLNQTDDDTHQFKINRSIALSIYSLRMKSNADALREFLALLSLLPGGIPATRESFDALQRNLQSFPAKVFKGMRSLLGRVTSSRADEDIMGASSKERKITDINSVIQTLETVGLISMDKSRNPHRIRMLPPY
ncbi:hypothetical protein BDN70DRAFT_881394 [Pholiota conissans]|uniref:NACHT domain-containing protein n=1 Tax=Pholiota conissans TaxID=109636 RepID=A0A9P5YWZ5_9AGAR|nr:hypothetical protein BDN70DRAFT_881394 [Pholiota conissans]